MIQNNAEHINSLINDAYLVFVGQAEKKISIVHSSVFVVEFLKLTEAISKRINIKIFQENLDLFFVSDYNLNFNSHLLMQTLENAIDNSLKAGANLIMIKAHDLGSEIAIEIVDNGTSYGVDAQNLLSNASIIPGGFGKIIMSQNIRQLSGRIEWCSRDMQLGMVVRICLPKIYSTTIEA